MTGVGLAGLAFVVFVLSVWHWQERFTRRPGEWHCPSCGVRTTATMGEHMRDVHGLERTQR